MCIAQTIPDGADVVNDGLDVAEDSFEHLLVMLLRREVERRRGKRPKLRKVRIARVLHVAIVEDVLANGLKQRARCRYRTLRVVGDTPNRPFAI